MDFGINDIEIIVIGGSAGSFNIVKRILSSLPNDFPIPIILCLHRLREVRSGFAESLNINSRIHVREVQDKETIDKGVYLSPSNYHLMIEPTRTFALSTEEDVNYSRPSIDITFESAGLTYKKNMAGILLSGTNSDGARGLYHAFKSGAYTIVQDPANAQFGIMPGEALAFFQPHLKLNDIEIIEFVNSLVKVN